MRNPFSRLVRQDDTKPTLRQRAVALKASAARVMRVRPAASPAASQTNTAAVHPDADLLAAAEQVRVLLPKEAALDAEHRRLCDLCERLAEERFGPRPDAPAAYDEAMAYDKRVAPIYEETGQRVAWQAWSDVSEEIWGLLGQFADRPAKTFEGAAAKTILVKMEMWDAESLAHEISDLFYNRPIAFSDAAPSPAPALASMVVEWVKIRDLFDSGNGPEDDEEANPLHQRWVDLQLAVYSYPAATLADLQAKVPVLLDEVTTLRGGRENPSPSLPTAAWLGVLADIGRLSRTRDIEAKSKASADTVDLSGLGINDLCSFYETLKAARALCGGAMCLPLAVANTDSLGCVNRAPFGECADFEDNRAGFLMDRAVDEATRRSPKDRYERDSLIALRIEHEIACEGRIRDSALLADIAQAWG